MKTIIIYKSKSGYTKTYAQWISEELSCDIQEAEKISPDDFTQYQIIIFGGGLYASGINGLKLITQNFDSLQNKHIFVWATGSNPGRQEELDEVWKYNFTPEQLQKIKTFYLRGGFDFSKLSIPDKILMRMLKRKLKATKVRSEDEEGMLKAYQFPENYCNKENITLLVKNIRDLERGE